jgi:formate dehydrogenase major subunit
MVKRTRFVAGETILQFAKRHIGEDYIPTLCDDPRLKPHGACRVCSVEVALQTDGPIRTVASCHTPIAARYAYFCAIRHLYKNCARILLS